MSTTIKELTLYYDPVNKTNTFTNGDIIQGRVFLEVAKEANINSFYIKCKGEATVRWSERHNDRTDTYYSHERYFKLKQVFIQDPTKQERNRPNVIITSGEIYGNVVRPGRHVYPFSFQLPHGDMPPSFKGYHGSVKYILEARLERSWKMDKTAITELNFMPQNAASAPGNNPQSAAIDKKLKLFTSGSVSMRATIDKTGYMRGDVIKVSTHVYNSSSRDLKLKYSLHQKQIFYAQGRTNNAHKTIFKVVGDSIPKGSTATVNKDLIIPPDLELTFAHCSIIKLEYTLKVYLDVPYAGDPTIRFTVIVLAADQISTPWQSQPAFPPYEPHPPPQNVFRSSPPGANFEPAPVLYPSPVYPQPDNPSSPPPSYRDVYPNRDQTFSGYQPAPLPPAYSALRYSGPSAPQQLPQGAPEFFSNPSAPAHGQAASSPATNQSLI